MRVFNTEGPNDPELHYTIIRQHLLDKGMLKIEQGKYFTIFAPRQSGKTTYFKMLMQIVRDKTSLFPIWLSFENYSNANQAEFYELFKDSLDEELGITVDYCLDKGVKLEKYYKLISEKIGKKLLLIIDEFDGIPGEVIRDFLHTFRKMYHKKDTHLFHSLMLVGVRNITGVNLDNASPFNIADEISIPYFSSDEVRELINQYVDETGQKFEGKVVEKIAFNTGGQPGLVNALCRELVENEAPDRTSTVKMENFIRVLNNFLTSRIDKNISNIVNKAKQQKETMIKILFRGSLSGI